MVGATMISKELVSQLQSLNDRLQKPAFSWQHSDFFLLQAMLPPILLILRTEKWPPTNTSSRPEKLGGGCRTVMIITDKQRIEIICQLDAIERLADKIQEEEDCHLFPDNIKVLCKDIKRIFGYDRED